MFCGKLIAAFALPLLLCGAARAAGPRTIAHPIPAPPFSQVMGASGYIFEGSVTKIQWVKPRNLQDVATVQITFRVAQGIRGAQTGQMLSVKEWAGAWNSNDHYRVGQNVVLFLYRPSKLGLTSPVSGPVGEFVVGTNSFIGFTQQQQNSLSSDPALGPAFGSKTSVSSSEFTSAIRHLAEVGK
ncbi:MAG TPA: hypothetical protein VGG46_06875 [Terriglobales bacterium]|jgi:hypothetical protein